VQLGATTAHARAEAHDRIAVNAGQPLNGTDRHALSQSGDDFNLLVAGKVVHGGPNPTFWESGPPCGKLTDLALHCAEWSFSSGPNPGVDDLGPSLLQQ
jgi:hypothetical protein